ncbi:MAG: hypothetical protein AAF629_26715 [Chloroflexota bacterium]
MSNYDWDDWDDWEQDDWDDELEASRRPGIIAWLILFILVCALLFPLLSPLIRSYQYEFRPRPTPTNFPPNLVLHNQGL